MVEYLRHRQIIATPFANRSYQPRPKATAIRRSNLVTLTRPKRKKLSQPRKVNVGPLPKAMQRNWLITLMAKEAEAAASSQALTPTQPAEAPVTQFPISLLSPGTKYSAIWTPTGKICPNEYPMSSDWKKDLGEEERKGQDKGDNFSVCLDWDADLKEQERKKSGNRGSKGQ